MNISLGVGNRYTRCVELLFHLMRQIPKNGPVIFCFHPWAADEINRAVSEFTDPNRWLWFFQNKRMCRDCLLQDAQSVRN